MSKLGNDFYTKLIQISSNTGMNPEDILNVMAVESGLNPEAHNKNGNASGLVQFMPSTLKNLGYKGTHDQFRQLGGVQQLDYVEKLIKYITKVNGGPLTSAAQYYIGNFIPSALKIPGVKNKDPNTIIVSKKPIEAHIPNVSIEKEAIYYKDNSGLDYDKDDHITYGDIQKILQRAANKNSFKQAIEELRKYKTTPIDNTDDLFKRYVKKYKSSPIKVAPAPVATILPAPNIENDNMEKVLSKYLQMVASLEKSNRTIYKTFLPKQNINIKINSMDCTTSIEFCRILSSVLENELICQTYTHGSIVDNAIELQCTIHGPLKECLYAVKELSEITKNSFISMLLNKYNCNIDVQYTDNKISEYKPLDIKVAQKEYRKFLLKIAR